MSSLAQPLRAEGRQGRYARVNDQLDPSKNLKLKKNFFYFAPTVHGKLFYSKKRSGSKSSLKSVYSGTFRRLSPFPHSLLTLHTRRAEKGLEKRAERGSSSSFRSQRQEQDGTPDKLGNRNFISSLLASPPPFPPMLQGSKRRAGGRILCEKREGALNVCKRDLAKKGEEARWKNSQKNQQAGQEDSCDTYNIHIFPSNAMSDSVQHSTRSRFESCTIL